MTMEHLIGCHTRSNRIVGDDLEWFLPRDVMRKRGLCRHAVSMCVRHVLDHVKTNKRIFKFNHQWV